MNVVLVHNPGAGGCAHTRDSLARLIRNAGHDVADFSSKEDDWREALARGVDLVAAAGGDGTVAEVARAIVSTGVPLAVLPLGTANNIATALGQVNVTLDEVVAGWAAGALQPFDVGVATGAWGSFTFLESVGAGLLADMMAEIDRGPAGYVNEIDDPTERMGAALDLFQRLLQERAPLECEIMLDGKDLSGAYVMVEALNFGTAGPNLRLSPTAAPGDGLLDLVLLDDRGRHELAAQLPDYRRGATHASALRVLRGRELRLRCDATLHLDDEIRSPRKHGGELEITVRRHALTFLIPPPVAAGVENSAA